MRYLQFLFKRPGDLIYIAQLLAHAVLTLDTDSPMILSGWGVTTTTNQHNIIQTLDEYTFGVRRGKWRDILLEKKFISITRMGVLFPQQALRKVRND